MSSRFKRLSHTVYECKYHIVFCPKYRFRIFKNEIAEYTKQRIYVLCNQKELLEVLELNVREDHVYGFPRSIPYHLSWGISKESWLSGSFRNMKTWESGTGGDIYGPEATVSALSDWMKPRSEIM